MQVGEVDLVTLDTCELLVARSDFSAKFGAFAKYPSSSLSIFLISPPFRLGRYVRDFDH